MGQQAALQDQMNAQGMLGQLGAAGRQADIGVANANAGYQMGANTFNAQQGMAANELNSRNYLQLLAQLQGLNLGELQAQQAAAQGTNDRNAGLLGALIGAGGQVAGAKMMSDERLKTDIADARHEVDEMLDALGGAKRWRYKDPKHGAGTWT